MRLKTIIDEDFTNYKKPAMFIGTISCGGKCCIEAKIPLTICQNDSWRSCESINLSDDKICERYLVNPITQSIVLGGLEPFEQFDEVKSFIYRLRNTYNCNDDIVIYTGYNYNEIEKEINILSKFSNVIVKFGRYIPNRSPIYDAVLGVKLASDNQYAERISK